jgi:hypothetical protein
LRGANRHSRFDRALEQLVVGVLEDEADRRGRVATVTSRAVVPPSMRTLHRRSVGGRPLRCLTRVVLPEPFWPRIATALPGAIDSEDARDGLDAGRDSGGRGP